jgi:hypothetical protein
MLFSPRTIRVPFDPAKKPREPAQAGHVGLDPAHDRHALAALEAYADSCASELPHVAAWLQGSLGQPTLEASRCAATTLRVFDQAHEWAATQPDYARLAWEHVREHLLAALERKPQPAEEPPPEAAD